MNDINKTLLDREFCHGDFNKNAKVSRQLKDILIAAHDNNPAIFTIAQQEALEMICHNLARIVNGDPQYAESWRNISGYATLIVNDLHKTEGATDVKIAYQIVKNGRLIDVD
jgi:hypothetical protein